MQRTAPVRRRPGLLLAAVLCLALAGCSKSNSPPPPGPPADVSGVFTWDSVPTTQGSGLDYTATLRRPGRGLVIEAVATNGATLATGTTGSDGSFVLSVDSTRAFYLRVKAQMLASGTPSWNFRVIDNTSSGALYFHRSPASGFHAAGNTGPFTVHASSGWSGSEYTFARSAAPFAILDVVRNAVDLIVSADATATFQPLAINWSVNNIAACCNVANGQISTSSFFNDQLYILGHADNDTDEYDTHVVAHEFGHYFEAFFSRADNVGGSHTGASRLDPRVAFGEGFGNAFSGMVQGTRFYIDTFNDDQGTSGIVSDLDDNMEWESQEGWWNETSVQAILYDLFDASNDGVDSVSLGFGPLYAVLSGAQRVTLSFTTPFSFIHHLKVENPGSSAAIDTLVAGEGIGSIVDEWDASGALTDIASFGPLYTPMGINAGATQLCGTDADGNYNRRLNRRLFYFEVVSTALLTVQASSSGGSDPGVAIYASGQEIAYSDPPGNATAQISRSLAPGFYTGEVYHVPHVETTSSVGTRCIDLSLTQ